MKAGHRDEHYAVLAHHLFYCIQTCVRNHLNNVSPILTATYSRRTSLGLLCLTCACCTRQSIEGACERSRGPVGEIGKIRSQWR